MITATVDVKLDGMAKFKSSLDKNPSAGPIMDALKQWAVRYRAFVQRRFDRFSKGGGDWPALAESTIRGRRQGTSKATKRSSLARRPVRDEDGKIVGHRPVQATKKNAQGKVMGVSVSILRDTGTLFAALAPQFTNAPGALQQFGALSVEVGFGGAASHPGAGITVAELAFAHQIGHGRLPPREIIVEPDAETLRGMAGDMQRALGKMGKDMIG